MKNLRIILSHTRKQILELQETLTLLSTRNWYINFVGSHREQACGCQGEEGEVGMDWEFGVDRCKLLNSEWISSEVLLYSTGNSIQSLVIDHDGKQHKKKRYIWDWVTLQQKLAQHCIIYTLIFKKLEAEREENSVFLFQEKNFVRSRHKPIFMTLILVL